MELTDEDGKRYFSSPKLDDPNECLRRAFEVLEIAQNQSCRGQDRYKAAFCRAIDIDGPIQSYPPNSLDEAGKFNRNSVGAIRSMSLDTWVLTLGLHMHPLSLSALMTGGMRLPVREYERTGKMVAFTPGSRVGRIHLGLNSFDLGWQDEEVVLIVR